MSHVERAHDALVAQQTSTAKGMQAAIRCARACTVSLCCSHAGCCLNTCCLCRRMEGLEAQLEALKVAVAELQPLQQGGSPAQASFIAADPSAAARGTAVQHSEAMSASQVPEDVTTRLQQQQDLHDKLQAQCQQSGEQCADVTARLQRHDELASQLQEQCQHAVAQCESVAARTGSSWEDLHQGLADVSSRQAAALQLLQEHAQRQQQEREAQAAALQAAKQQQQVAQAAQAAAVQYAMAEFAKRIEVRPHYVGAVCNCVVRRRVRDCVPDQYTAL